MKMKNTSKEILVPFVDIDYGAPFLIPKSDDIGIKIKSDNDLRDNEKSASTCKIKNHRLHIDDDFDSGAYVVLLSGEIEFLAFTTKVLEIDGEFIY